MRGAAWVRALTPMGWGAAIALVLILGIGLARGLGLSWDPFGLGAQRLERAETAAERGRAESLARQLEAQGQAQQARQVAEAEARLRLVAEATAHSRTEARRAKDAEIPLDQARLDRLRSHDRQLCDHARPLDGCPTSAGVAD